MNQTAPMFIKAPPELIYKCLISPIELAKWWQCNAVVDARPGGIWALGWNPDAARIGHTVVMAGTFRELQENQVIAIEISPIVIVFRMAPTPGGTTFLFEQHNHPDPATAEAGLQTWIEAMNSMKAYVEALMLPVNSPASSQTPTLNVWDMVRKVGTPVVESEEGLLDSRGSKSGLYHLKTKEMSHPVDTLPAGAGEPVAISPVVDSTIRVQDDGGFGITDPWAEVISWKKEQGFGYALHPQLGEVMFDYDGCDFEPEVGDKVILLQLKKAWNGKPKCKRISCPAKGSNVKK